MNSKNPHNMNLCMSRLAQMHLEHSKSHNNPDPSYTEVNELLEMLVQKDISETNIFNMLFVSRTQTPKSNIEYLCTNYDSLAIEKMFIKTSIENDKCFLESLTDSKKNRN